MMRGDLIKRKKKLWSNVSGTLATFESTDRRLRSLSRGRHPKNEVRRKPILIQVPIQ